jgi:hypothetical protein
MNNVTLLLRQVHPNWIKGDRLVSLAFRPFPKDENLLSAYDGDLITAENSWRHYTGTGYEAVGVWAVTPGETQSVDLPARSDAEGHFPEHCVIDFSAHERKQQEAKSKILAHKAEARGRLHP